MDRYDVTIFKPVAFQVGQKIRIEGGQRGGDWEVIGVTGNKVKLRCPISAREFEWVNFCYHVEERRNEIWPRQE